MKNKKEKVDEINHISTFILKKLKQNIHQIENTKYNLRAAPVSQRVGIILFLNSQGTLLQGTLKSNYIEAEEILITFLNCA